eukprot:SM000122S25777  [mRNA]  locus=s122:215809:216281:- [translate_table: standard]
MALTNFLLTAAAVGAAVVLLRGDVRATAATLRRNVRHLRAWLEEEQAAGGAHKPSSGKPRELESELPPKSESKPDKQA